VLGHKLGQKVSEVPVVDACHSRYPHEFTTILFYLYYTLHFQCYPKRADGRGIGTPILACRLLNPSFILPRTYFISQGALLALQEAPS
jgi:hypothetical protein